MAPPLSGCLSQAGESLACACWGWTHPSPIPTCQQHGAASQFSHVLVGDLCIGNANSKVPCAPSPSLEKGFGEGSLPSITAWELSSHFWVRSLCSFQMQMPQMAAAPQNLQEQSPIQHLLRLAGTRGHLLALSWSEGGIWLKLLKSRLQFKGSWTVSAGISCWKETLGS